MAHCLLNFIMEIGDVYERARLAQGIVVTGDGATAPGFPQRLATLVDELARGRGIVRNKPFVSVIDTPFAADCVLWAGAAVLSDCGDSGTEDADRIVDVPSGGSVDGDAIDG